MCDCDYSTHTIIHVAQWRSISYASVYYAHLTTNNKQWKQTIAYKLTKSSKPLERSMCRKYICILSHNLCIRWHFNSLLMEFNGAYSIGPVVLSCSCILRLVFFVAVAASGLVCPVTVVFKNAAGIL